MTSVENLYFDKTNHIKNNFFSFLFQAITRKRREREGHTKTGDVYPLNDFSSPNAEEEERQPALEKIRKANYEEIEEDGDEITPFYNPGYRKVAGSSQRGLLRGHDTRV